MDFYKIKNYLLFVIKNLNGFTIVYRDMKWFINNKMGQSRWIGETYICCGPFFETFEKGYSSYML